MAARYLDRSRIVAPPGWSRWLILPVLSIHLDRPGLGVGLAAAAAGFVAMLSLSNMLGRFVWSSTCDMIGRRNIYQIV